MAFWARRPFSQSSRKPMAYSLEADRISVDAGAKIKRAALARTRALRCLAQIDRHEAERLVQELLLLVRVVYHAQELLELRIEVGLLNPSLCRARGHQCSERIQEAALLLPAERAQRVCRRLPYSGPRKIIARIEAAHVVRSACIGKADCVFVRRLRLQEV